LLLLQRLKESAACGKRRMDLKRFALFLLFGLAFGGGMEWLKRSAPEPIHKFHLDVPDLLPLRPRHARAVAKPALPKLETMAGLAAPIPAAPIAAVAKPAPAGKPSAKKPAKKDDKDKKKKEEGAQATAVGQVPAPDAAKKDGTPAADSGAPDSGAYYPPANPADSLPHSLQEWEAYILAGPNLTRVQFLVSQFQSGLVSPSIYYAVVQAMLGDGRQEMRHLGLFALEQTPSEPSFAMLAIFVDSGVDNQDRLEAQADLNEYGAGSRLGILAAALEATGNVNVNFEAMAVLKTSFTQTISKLALTSVPSGTATPVSSPSTSQKASGLTITQREGIAKQYASLATILAGLAASYPSASLRSAALMTEKQIRAGLVAAGFSST
jgi:hypothetical protein